MITGFLTSDLKERQLTLLDHTKSKPGLLHFYGLDVLIGG